MNFLNQFFYDSACVGLEKPDITIIMFHIFCRFCAAWITQALLYKKFTMFVFTFCNFIFRNFILNWCTHGSFPTILNLTKFGEVFGWDLVVVSSTAQNKKLDWSSYSVKTKVEITKADKNAFLRTLKWHWIQNFSTGSDTSASKSCWLRLDGSLFFWKISWQNRQKIHVLQDIPLSKYDLYPGRFFSPQVTEDKREINAKKSL